MDTVALNIERFRMVLTMFRITQGELARASGTGTLAPNPSAGTSHPRRQ